MILIGAAGDHLDHSTGTLTITANLILNTTMPQRWICCRCDNGWTLQPGADNNTCGNSTCLHKKCHYCEVRTYDGSGIIPHAPDKEDIIFAQESAQESAQDCAPATHRPYYDQELDNLPHYH